MPHTSGTVTPLPSPHAGNVMILAQSCTKSWAPGHPSSANHNHNSKPHRHLTTKNGDTTCHATGPPHTQSHRPTHAPLYAAVRPAVHCAAHLKKQELL